MKPKPKAKVVLAALLLPCIALAGDWRNGDAALTPKSKFVSQLTVNWVTVSNVQATCEAESKRRGLGGFGYGVAACSFWTDTTCTIVTSKTPTQHEIGHEVAHCYWHNWHP